MSIHIIAENRKARFNYDLLERFEAGLVLLGPEVKSLRAGNANIGDAYAIIQKGEVFLMNAHISPYQARHYADHDPLRMRKLLLHAHEIKKLVGHVQEKGFTLVPTKIYFKEGRAKIEIALAKSKNTIDKRQTLKKRETDRQVQRVLRAKSR